MKEKMIEEHCEQCNQKSTSTKVRWDLELPLVLCDDCYNKRQSVQNTKSGKKENSMES
jgi:hypothetical protein